MAGKTRLFQPGGVVPVENLYKEAGLLGQNTSGDVWWVNSATGSDTASSGRQPTGPFKTMDYAISQAGKNNGDRIYVFPGHVETLSAAGSSQGNGGIFCGATLSGDLQIIGLGTGRNRPTVKYGTAVAASMNILAANITLRNIVFDGTGQDNTTALINVSGADVSFVGCEFQMANATASAALGILTSATADRLIVDSCRFLGPASTTGSTCAGCIQHEAGVDYLIQNCEFTLKCTQAIKNVATVLRGRIKDCTFLVTGTVAITMAAASTPFIINCRFNTGGGTAPVVAAAGFVVGNAYSSAAGVTAGTALTW